MAARQGKAVAMAAATETKLAKVPAARPVKTPPAQTPNETAAPVPAAAEAPTETAVAAIGEAVASEAASTAVQAGTNLQAGSTQLGVTMEKTMEQVTKTADGLFKAAEEAAEFSRGNLEAMAKATQLYVAGVQDLGKQTLALVQGLTDHTVAGAKALGSVKSLKEAAEVQASYARTAMEKSFAETAKLQEAALKLAEASFAPISARMTLAVEKFSKPLAA